MNKQLIDMIDMINLMKNHGVQDIDYKASWQIVRKPISLVFGRQLVPGTQKNP
jgi:hypothetical protein